MVKEKKYWDNPISTDGKGYDYVNPSHYRKGSVETIDRMVAIWGKAAVSLHCEMCAFKYRERMGSKPGQGLDLEMKKIRWYENKAKELTDSLD